MNYGNVKVRPAPVRFHSDCTMYDIDFSRCTKKVCRVQPKELACPDIILRFVDNHEPFKCAHCGLSGQPFKSIWIRTEFMKDGTPVDVYKCGTCEQLTALYHTAKAQKCRKFDDIILNEGC